VPAEDVGEVIAWSAVVGLVGYTVYSLARSSGPAPRGRRVLGPRGMSGPRRRRR